MANEQERLLAQFEKKSAVRPSATDGYTAPIDEDGEYRAFKAVDRKQRRLLVRPVGKSCEWVTYQYLLRIVLDPRQTRLALIFSFMAVKLSGRNLGPIAEAVADERCDFVQQFDPKQWKAPEGVDAPIIEAVEFVTDRPPAEVIAA